MTATPDHLTPAPEAQPLSKIQIWLGADVKKKLDCLCKQTGLAANQIIRQLLDKNLPK
jgi:hypothetical protein